MPRKKKTAVPMPGLADSQDIGDDASFGAVVALNPGARPLMTIGPDSVVWGQDVGATVLFLNQLKEGGGVPALIRMFPPAAAHPDDVSALVLALINAKGVAGVKVMPYEARSTVPVAKSGDPLGAKTAREVVALMAVEIPSQDRAALEKLCEDTMTGVGL